MSWTLFPTAGENELFKENLKGKPVKREISGDVEGVIQAVIDHFQTKSDDSYVDLCVQSSVITALVSGMKARGILPEFDDILASISTNLRAKIDALPTGREMALMDRIATGIAEFTSHKPEDMPPSPFTVIRGGKD